MTVRPNQRELEPGLRRDLRDEMSYERYLCLDQLLSAQRPLTNPTQHDELLFIIQHQTSELWFKLAIHELRAIIDGLTRDDTHRALKGISRVKQVQHQLFEQWGVLETLTPNDYASFRDVLRAGSGFQSPQYRELEFLLGNKNRDMLDVFKHSPDSCARLAAALEAPSLYDEFLRHLARAGHPVPPECVERDWSESHRNTPALLPIFKAIYESPEEQWPRYQLCEQLVDTEESFQLWRFRHLKAVERIIGSQSGTGGSSGLPFLRAALDLTFFPELLEVRAEIGK